MRNCTSIEPLVTPYVDGEIGDADRRTVDDHLRVCAPCHSRVVAEQAIRGLIRARKSALNCDCAPPALRARCTRTAHLDGRTAPTPTPWRHRVAPLALAATVVLVVSGAFLYQFTDSSSRLLAAELTADHVKCFGAMNAMFGTDAAPSAVEQSMTRYFGWSVQLPPSGAAGLQLVGARPCLYGDGRVAHIMYRHHGDPVSVFMLPNKTRPEEVLEVLGHEAAIWSDGNRTFVVIAREPRAEVERIASAVQASLR